MSWTVLLLAATLALIVLRIYFKLRMARKLRTESWDEQVIARLRSQGYAPFNDYQVDFFLALPSEAACHTVRASLEAEGFRVDVKPVPEGVDQPFSLHATKALRLSVPDMRETSRRFGELARLNGGRYDGWMPGAVEQSG